MGRVFYNRYLVLLSSSPAQHWHKPAVTSLPCKHNLSCALRAELAPLTYSQIGLDLAVKCESPRGRTRSGEWPQMVMISV